MEITNIDLEDAIEMSFEIVHEDWNVYKLEDGSLLRIRPIVIKVIKTTQLTLEGLPLIGLGAINVITASVPEDLKNKPSADKSILDVSKKVIEFNVIKEPWNVFKLEDDSLLKVKLVVSRVTRTPKFNKFGEPIYIATSSSVIDLQPAE
ncbi:MAG: hypothetical protein ACTSUO_06390 [Candidatus Thorarchaeota archaeon]